MASKGEPLKKITSVALGQDQVDPIQTKIVVPRGSYGLQMGESLGQCN